MMRRVRFYSSSLALVVPVLGSTLLLASGAKMKIQDDTVSKKDSAGQVVVDGQSQTLLPDGRTLFAGGIASDSAIKGVAFLNPKSGTRADSTGFLSRARAFHSATILPSGKVLIFGGVGDGGLTLGRAELFDPESQSSSELRLTGLTPRSRHTGTLLTDGRVLFAGGLDAQGNAIREIQIWDSRFGQTTTLAEGLSAARIGHSATLRPDGTVLLYGGHDEAGNALKDCEVIDPNGPSVRIEPRLFQPVESVTPPILAASMPQNGETDLPTDEIISLRFSKPLDVTSVNAGTVTLRPLSGDPVATTVVPAESGMLTFVTPKTALQNGTLFVLTVSGAKDSEGHTVADTTLQFTTEVAADAVGTAGGVSSGSNSGNAAWPSEIGASAAVSTQWRNLPMLVAPEGETALAGQVLKLDGSPLANVLLDIGHERASTDSAGRFLLRNLGPGHHIMLVDGGPAGSDSKTYGIYRIGVDLKAGTTNSLNYVVWMTALDTQHFVNISSPTASDLVVSNPAVPGVELHIPAGTVIHDARGKLVTEIGITPIPTKQPPFPLKNGAIFPVYFTIQPAGASFSSPGASASSLSSDTQPRGAKIYYENRYNAKPGVRFAFWNYDPAQKGWYVYGHGQVTEDSKMIVPDPNTQIFSFDGAMVSLPSNAPPFGPIPGGPQCCEPIDMQTGLFVYKKTDLELRDVLPLRLTRTYRQSDYQSRAFGIGTNMDYDMFMVGDAESTPEGYTYQDLILADGGRIHFTRTSPCRGTNGYCDYSNAVYSSTSTPGPFYGATLQFMAANGSSPDYWLVSTKDSSIYKFPDSDDASNPRQAALIGMNDRYGNSLAFTRVNSNLTQITSPNGRYISFTYDSDNRVVSTSDSAGRSTSYTYNPQGYLATATDANGGVTTYTYDTSGNMTSIQDPRGIVYLQNQYDVNDRVSQQTQADGGVYQLSYSLDSNGNVIQTNVTDPRGYLRIVTFNGDGHMTSDTRPVGKPEVQATTFEVQDGTGLILSETDALNRQTAFTYDTMANVTSVTTLAQTAGAATTWFTYYPAYQQLSSVTDPLGNETLFTYDPYGNLVSASDPLGNTTSYSNNTAGQPITIMDPQGVETQLAYSSGLLASTTDGLQRTTFYASDGAGRIVGVTDPLGFTYQYAYNPLDEVTTITDPLGNQTAFTYDGNGNRLTVEDANQHTTTYTYDNMDRVQTRKDPLGNQESAQYDLNGNLSQATDRKGQVTSYIYDGLNRPTLVTFNDGSTTANTFDAGNRLTTVADSITGSISRNYDGLDNLLSETTPQGSVAYTYDADSRRQTMTASGQSQVNYVFDNASRLASITQGSTNVAFGYDSDGRRAFLNLPNGVTANYSYDAASELTSIVYQGGALAPADLEYSYDLAGRRTSVGGSLASTQLPAAVSSAVYNANNQLTQWGSTAMTYDLNGDTLNDGMNSYLWDARNRLVSADSNGATFAYDPLGRRINKNILTASTGFLYDGVNPIQELNGSTVTANLLTGGVDERFLRTTSTETDNYLTDALGSTVALTGSTGSSQVEYSYGPFGSISITGTTTNSYTYTGREIDGLGINYYRARYYNPATGRFLSEDPAGFAAGTNFYAYVDDDPIDFLDPFGLDKKAPNNGRNCSAGSASAGQYAAASAQVAAMTAQFFSGLGNANPTFGPNTATSAVMGQSAGVQDALNEYYMTGATHDLYSFGGAGYVNAGANPVAQFVGSFRWSISGGILSLTNVTSFKSLTYDKGPQWQRSSFGPMGNTHQTYQIGVTCH